MGISRKKIIRPLFLIVLIGSAFLGPWQFFMLVGTIGAFLVPSYVPFVLTAALLDGFFAGDASSLLPFPWGLFTSSFIIAIVSVAIRSYTRIESYAPTFSRN